MADFHIGLDFGTSQTKVCLLNKNSGIREFLEFDNNSYFLPSVIVKKTDNTLSYGDENSDGIKYRYFKMAAAEDDDLIQITNEDLDGNLQGGNIADFRKYSTNFEIKPEILVVLYLTYVYLCVQEKKKTQNTKNASGLLGRLAGNNNVTENTYSINLGIPTEWNNPNHIKRKIKFQSLLLTAVELSIQFQNIKIFLSETETELLKKIAEINQTHLNELENRNSNEIALLVHNWLQNCKLSVFPESAAGINYLLKTNRLANGAYATLDIGAGTSDIAIFEVLNNELALYYCSESVEIASNDFYREYAKQINKRNVVTFEEIKQVENIIRNPKKKVGALHRNARNIVRGFLNSKGIEFAIRKTFFRKHYIKLYKKDRLKAFGSKTKLDESDIIVFGGGANLESFCSGKYCFYQGNNPHGLDDRSFVAKPITDYVQQVDISDDNSEFKII